MSRSGDANVAPVAATLLTILAAFTLWQPYENLWPYLLGQWNKPQFDFPAGYHRQLAVEAVILAAPIWLGMLAGLVTLIPGRSIWTAWAFAAGTCLLGGIGIWGIVLFAFMRALMRQS